MRKHTLLLLFFFSCLTSNICSYNLRQISNRDGLSNSSVTCLFQDDERFLWIGTYDGLNMYDSRNIYIYKPDINNQNSLSSNVIRNIIETDSIYLWISTKWGLNKLSQQSNTIEAYYNEFGENSYMAKDSHDNLYVLSKPDVLSFYSKVENKFIDLPVHKGIEHNTVLGMLIDAQDTIWINHQGVLERYTVSDTGSDQPSIKRHSDFKHAQPIEYAFYHNEKIIIVDSIGDIYYITTQGIHFVKNLNKLINESGEIGSIIFDNDDLLIGFRTNGLIRLDAAKGYELEKIEINCGVFSLWKDEQQDIIWIGTDGQGIYAWTKDEYAFNNLSLNQLPINKRRPIRAIHTDQQNTLWLGTKDNGIIRIKDYDVAQEYSTANVTHFTVKDGLTNNAVFAFTESKSHPILWIGSDGPELNYYSYRDNKIHSLINNTNSRIARVHSMSETCDSLLWVGSGSRLLRISIEAHGNTIKAKDIRTIYFRVPNRQQYNQIYSIYPENDSILWIGMRGNGVIRLNTQTEAYQLISFDKNGIAPMNDILCIHQDKNKIIWVGSSYGLTRLTLLPNGEYDYKNFNENEGLPNNTIHGIAEDPQGNLWLSSNTGIILFDSHKNTFRNLNHKTGLKVIEFSDNAYFQDSTKKRYFFGGVDGIVWIENGEKKRKDFIPDIFFTKLRIFNKDYNISEFEKSKGNKREIVLKHDQNFFAVSFVAMDFINGENSKYSYKLENFSNVWMDTRSNEAQFTNIPPGNYILRVKYDDGSSSNENLTQSIYITILPPWYWSIAAQTIYVLLLIGAGLGLFRYIRWKYERRKASIDRRLKEKYKEEMYEGKLRFFTNITHEFCTPLSLIYGPCIRILDNKESSPLIKKYANLIKSNTERLNGLIQEIIDFRRMETGNKICIIKQLSLGRIAKDMIESFTDVAERNNIKFETEFDHALIWNSDESCFVKIANNLLSNAFKYTPSGGTIWVKMYITENKLIFSVYNTGKGIPEKDISNIFNRYTILDNISENSVNELSARNGLGLAIAYSMAELLKGNIEVESIENNYTCFTVTLPYLEVDNHVKDISDEKKHTIEPMVSVNGFTEDNDLAVLSSLPAILVIDDNKDILWMIKDIFREEYTVLTAENAEEGMKALKKYSPSLVITDIMMPGIDGITLTRQIKQNQHLMHIPIIILSAKNDNSDKVAGVNSGADIYITKPFDVNYLKTVVTKLLEKSKNLETYYSTSASAFEFISGQLVDREDKELIEKAMRIIAENISNNEFTPQELASSLQISIRNLYRKFEQLNLSPPKNFIKEQRINFAARLLVTTSLTIEEIMYQSGFMNRSHFYKEFTKRMGMAPKDYRLHNKK